MPVGTNNDDRVARYLDLISTYDHALSLEEILDLARPDIDCEVLQDALKSDARFISLGGSSTSQVHFVSKKELFLWFARLTRRLAKVNQNRLNEQQLASLMNSLSTSSRWDVLPVEVVEFGQRFGFIGHAYTPGYFVFPLAHILSLMPEDIKKMAYSVLESIQRHQSLDTSSSHSIHQIVNDALLCFDPKVRQVVQARAGLGKSGKKTLQQIGDELHLTRERIRQLEGKFRKGLKKPAIKRAFIAALLHDIVGNHGSLIMEADSADAPVRQFIANCVDIPQSRLPNSKLVVIGTAAADIPALKSTGWSPEEIDIDTVATRLDSTAGLCLNDQDIRTIAETIVRFRRKQCTKGQKAYLALRAIGRPANSTEITEVYNSLFPESISTKRNLHAVLNREEYGVVYIGVRSTFALREWGYEHPQKTLFDTVEEIVNNKFMETASPVPFQVIIAEIGKYRKVVRPASLAIAAYCNPALQCVSKNYFMPRKGSVEATEKEISGDELDKILKEFEFGPRLNLSESSVEEPTEDMTEEDNIKMQMDKGEAEGGEKGREEEKLYSSTSKEIVHESAEQKDQLLQKIIACPRCGWLGTQGQRFCGACGTLLSYYCPVCRSPIESSYRFCIICGVKLYSGI